MSNGQGVGELWGKGEAENEPCQEPMEAGTEQERKEQARMRKATGLH